MSDFFGGITAALSTMRDGLRERADHLDVAIDALSKAGSPMPALAAAALPALPAPVPVRAKADKAKGTDHRGHQVHGAARPRTSVCRNEPCGKEFAVKGPGRVPHYCSDVCRTASGKKARKAGVAVMRTPGRIAESASGRRGRAVTPAPERKRIPRADRPVDDRELDSLLARGKRGAAA